MRISKSVIVNIKKIEYLAPAFNKKLIFKLESGKEEYSSRTYYTKIKEKLGV
jgi:DNA-binding LytR/AlgR family response regulator